jgi:phage host-nuclease inhibitor protein Gam
MNKESSKASVEQMGIELGRLRIRLDGLKEDKKEAVADYAAQIKTCEKEIRRLAMELQQQKVLFEKGS